MSAPTLDTVRACVASTLGDDRLAGVDPQALLLRKGLVTSIELVTLMVDLEARFDQPVPESAMAPDTLSLAGLVAALGGEAARPPPPRVMPRPLVALVVALLSVVLIDRGVGLLVRGPLSDTYRAFLEDGHRLYPVAGGFSQDDFAFAVGHHRVQRPAPGPRVWMFGDSGTIGSYVTVKESLPAQVEMELRRMHPQAQVENLAWFGRLFVKDVMLLETVWDKPVDAVVFTVGQDYFSKRKVQTWLSRYRHCSVNWPLFEQFVQRVPADQRAPFERVLARLRAADAAHGGAWRRFGFEYVELEHYRPFLRYLFLDEGAAQLGPFFSPYRFQLEVMGRRRVLKDRTGEEVQPGLVEADVDEDQIQIMSTIVAMLADRGVSVVLYVEPTAPADWKRVVSAEGRRTGAQLARSVVEQAGMQGSLTSSVVDTSWFLNAEAFIDSQAHYEPEANARLGSAVGRGLIAVMTAAGELEP